MGFYGSGFVLNKVTCCLDINGTIIFKYISRNPPAEEAKNPPEEEEEFDPDAAAETQGDMTMDDDNLNATRDDDNFNATRDDDNLNATRDDDNLNATRDDDNFNATRDTRSRGSPTGSIICWGPSRCMTSSLAAAMVLSIS